MRHGKKVNHLGRTSSHREALLSNMASSLILNKRITTTVAKAKALKRYVEPLITKAKDNTTHSRRTVMSYLQNKESVTTLFGEVAGRIADRPGGYTRIIKLSAPRLGDAADMCLLELVDFNDIYKKDGAEKKGKTRRGRRTKKSEAVPAAEETSAEVKAGEEAPKKASKKAKKKE
ncbi:MAG: 50S ribosomal protein L17 [Cyclobacteriaceae bacterium]|nr:50S ribosomal protein L17 [Cyclobacteriaceae bacterium]